MKRTVYVYGLLCPYEEKIRYVGLSEEPVARLRVHVKDTRSPRKDGALSAKQRWLQELKEADEEPTLVILEEIHYERPEGVWHNRKLPGASPHLEAEERWIERLRAEGHPLTNRYQAWIEGRGNDHEELQQAIERGKQLFG